MLVCEFVAITERGDATETSRQMTGHPKTASICALSRRVRKSNSSSARHRNSAVCMNYRRIGNYSQSVLLPRIDHRRSGYSRSAPFADPAAVFGHEASGGAFCAGEKVGIISKPMTRRTARLAALLVAITMAAHAVSGGACEVICSSVGMFSGYEWGYRWATIGVRRILPRGVSGSTALDVAERRLQSRRQPVADPA